MGVLDDLIKMKTTQQGDDLLKMIDEVSAYEKLAVSEELKDLKNSDITRAKCPMLAAFVDGGMYESILAELTANIYLQIEGHIPQVLQQAVERTEKQQKQRDILGASIATVEYRSIIQYDHETMKGLIAGVFTKKTVSATIIVIVVRKTNGYVMYHGTYSEKDVDESVAAPTMQVISKGQFGIFTMRHYSVLGNNAYKFGKYSNKDMEYDVMIGPDGILYLITGEIASVVHPIPSDMRNNLNMEKKDPQKFADQVTEIIESVVQL